MSRMDYSTDIVLAKGISSRMSQLDDMYTLAQQLLRQVELKMIDYVSHRLNEMAKPGSSSSSSKEYHQHQHHHDQQQLVQSNQSLANGFTRSSPRQLETLEALRERSVELKKLIAIINDAKADWAAWVSELRVLSVKRVVSCWLQMPLKYFGDTLTGLL